MVLFPVELLDTGLTAIEDGDDHIAVVHTFALFRDDEIPIRDCLLYTSPSPRD